VGHNIQRLHKQRGHIHNTAHAKHEKQIVNSIKEKLTANRAIIPTADKGNSIVVIYAGDYHQMVMGFIANNSFDADSKNPTNKFQKPVRHTINCCQSLIHPNHQWKYINLNPTPPTITSLIKVHKEECPIRPIINWTNALAYKIAKLLFKKLEASIPLPNTFNIRNSAQLITDLKKIPTDYDLRFASFDITNMYSNIPTTNLIKIIEQSCDQHKLHHDINTEILKLSNTLIQQNYIQYQDLIYIQKEGLAMGDPTSSLFSEIFLEHTEVTKIVHILLQYHIIGYFRYVDDILIAYKQNLTNIHEVLACFNKLTPTLKFTSEKETANKINFLDISIIRNDNFLSFSIYRKPTTTDTIIPNDSCHSSKHKAAAIRFLTHQCKTYNLNDASRTN
jgi:hypothetical protein